MANKTKAKQQQKQSPPQQKRPAKFLRGGLSPQGETTKNIPQYLTALVDPFNGTTIGAKIPDQDLSYSATAYSDTEQTFATDGTYGVAAAFFYPDPSSDWAPLTASGATNVNVPATWASSSTVPNISSIRAAFGLARCVAWGVRIYCPLNTQVAGGRIHVCLVPLDYAQSAGYAGAIPNSVSTMQQLPGYQNFSLQTLIDQPLLVTGRMSDTSGAYRYRDVGVPWNLGSAQITAGVESSAGWLGIQVIVEGAPISVSAFSVEVRKHYECLVKGNTGVGVIHASAPMPYQPAVLAATNNIVSAVPAVRVTNADGSDEDQLFKDLHSAWKTGLQVANGVGNAVEWMAGLVGMFL